MPKQFHTIERPDGANDFSQNDRIVVALLIGVANAAGSGAGAAVTVVVNTLKNLPAKCMVKVSPNQDATWFISAKNSTGFTVNLNPRLAANTLAAGTIDIEITA